MRADEADAAKIFSAGANDDLYRLTVHEGVRRLGWWIVSIMRRAAKRMLAVVKASVILVLRRREGGYLRARVYDCQAKVGIVVGQLTFS